MAAGAAGATGHDEEASIDKLRLLLSNLFCPWSKRPIPLFRSRCDNKCFRKRASARRENSCCCGRRETRGGTRTGGSRGGYRGSERYRTPIKSRAASSGGRRTTAIVLGRSNQAKGWTSCSKDFSRPCCNDILSSPGIESDPPRGIPTPPEAAVVTMTSS